MEKFQSLADVLGVADPEQPDAPPVPPKKVSLREFARDLLNSPEYRASLLRRIVMDELPAAVECLLYHYAHGKPAERVEHTGKDGAPIVTEIRRVIVRTGSQMLDDEPEQPKKQVTH